MKRELTRILALVCMLAFMPMGVLAADYAVILKTLSNPFWVDMKNGIEGFAREKGIEIDIYAVASEADVQSQMRLFEDVMNRDYKGIAFAPLSANNLVFPVADAYKKGIYLVNIDERIDMEQLRKMDANVEGFVTTDNVAVGRIGASFIIRQLGEKGGQVAIIEGKAGAISGNSRREGAASAFEEAANIEIVASQPADWDRLKALDVATNIIQRNPDVAAFYCANDTMALGAMQAVINVGKEGKILVVGTDGTPEARKLVAEGKLSATVAQDPAEIGRQAVQLLLDAVDRGELIGPEAEPAIGFVPALLINQ